MRARAAGLAVLAGAALGLAVALLLLAFTGGHRAVTTTAPQTAPPANASWPAGARPAPAFTLKNQDGRTASLASLRRRVVLLTFLDSHCTQLCPIEGALLASVQRALPADVQEVIMVVSANPQDTPASVRSAARRWGWTPGSWQWLLGDADELAPIWRSYGVDVRPGAGDVLHSGVLYVIDQAGNQRAGYGVPFEPQHVAQLVRSLDEPARP